MLAYAVANVHFIKLWAIAISPNSVFTFSIPLVKNLLNFFSVLCFQILVLLLPDVSFYILYQYPIPVFPLSFVLSNYLYDRRWLFFLIALYDILLLVNIPDSLWFYIQLSLLYNYFLLFASSIQLCSLVDPSGSNNNHAVCYNTAFLH